MEHITPVPVESTIEKTRTFGKHIWWQIAVPAFYFLWLLLFYPFRNVFWMDHDEGINLVKAQMLLRGFSLYKDIWNDQPPLFTYLMAGLFRLWGLRINVAREFVLLIACGLFFLYLNYVYAVWGGWAAAAGVLLLVLLPRFADLSVSVMIGLPSIAFAMLALVALLYWHRQHRYFWLILSALGLAASVLTKLFTGFLAPIFFIGILIGEAARFRSARQWRQIILPGFVWGAIFALVAGLPILLLAGPSNLNQLMENHIGGAGVEFFANDPTLSLVFQLIDARLILLLAGLGVIQAVIFKRWQALYPTAWMLTAFVLLYNHKPVWSHQQLLVTIPAAILAAGAAGEAIGRLVDLLRSRSRVRALDFVHLASLLVFAAVLWTRLPVTLAEFNTTVAFRSPPLREASTEVAILNKIREYAPETRWLVTDLPIYAFYSDLPVPPNLVVFSQKRVETGNLTEAEILSTIEKLQPEQILFGRSTFPAVQRYLQEHYQLVHAREPLYLYRINALVSPEEIQP